MTAQPKLLTQLVQAYQTRHQRPPTKIIIDPLALVALGLRKSVAPIWNGIPVECREIAPGALSGPANALGVHTYVNPQHTEEAYLQAFDVCL